MCGPQFHIQSQKKLSAGRSFEKFSNLYCSEPLLYDNLCKNSLINVIFRSNKIAAGHIGQAMGPHAARGPPVWHAWFRSSIILYHNIKEIVFIKKNCDVYRTKYFLNWLFSILHRFVKFCVVEFHQIIAKIKNDWFYLKV